MRRLCRVNVSSFAVMRCARRSRYEHHAFLAEMGHTDKQAHHSWRLRVGTSGNVNSFIGPYGEAIPPQKHDKAPWIDEVWQMVAVSQEKHGQNGSSYFIHQAGTYQKDGEHLKDVPFYSPSIAKHCEGDTCYFVSWGQHAHVPTPFESRLLYYTRYRDCGDGVLEVTYAMHHDPTASETVDYLNVPWGGVRTTQLRDFLVSQKGGGPAKETVMHHWGSTQSDSMIKNLDTLGGYTTFAEDLPNPKPAAFNLPTGIAIRPRNVCRESTFHTAAWKMYTVKCGIYTTRGDTLGCRDCALLFTNTKTGKSARVKGVLHWAASGGGNMFIWPVGSAAEFSSAVGTGETLVVTRYYDPGKHAKDNLALSFVHGTDKEYHIGANKEGTRAYFKKASRLRVGHTSQAFEGTFSMELRLILARIRSTWKPNMLSRVSHSSIDCVWLITPAPARGPRGVVAPKHRKCVRRCSKACSRGKHQRGE